tara:strand:- start:284 stop:553 length:270 start_codon:yes stop_codon:yes gene_type:complete
VQAVLVATIAAGVLLALLVEQLPSQALAFQSPAQVVVVAALATVQAQVKFLPQGLLVVLLQVATLASQVALQGLLQSRGLLGTTSVLVV